MGLRPQDYDRSQKMFDKYSEWVLDEQDEREYKFNKSSKCETPVQYAGGEGWTMVDKNHCIQK